MLNNTTLQQWCNRVFWFSLVIYVFSLPIPNTIVIRNSAFLFLCLATVARHMALKNWPKAELATAWGLYAVVALFSCVYAISPEESLREVRVEIFYTFIVFTLAISWFQTNRWLTAFFLLAAIANLTFVSISLCIAGFDKSFHQLLLLPGWARTGFDTNYLLPAMPIIAYLLINQWRQGHVLRVTALSTLLLGDLTAIFLGFNRQALVSIVAGILCGAFLLRKHLSRKHVALAACGLALLAGLFVAQMMRRGISSESAATTVQTAVTQDVRWQLWKFSLSKIAENPLAGGGIGRPVFRKLYPEFMPEDPNLWHAHNMIINKGIQMGIPGMVAFLFLWFSLWRAFAAHLSEQGQSRELAIVGITTLVMVFLKNMTDDFFLRDAALWFWLVSGVILGSLRSLQVREGPVVSLDKHEDRGD